MRIYYLFAVLLLSLTAIVMALSMQFFPKRSPKADTAHVATQQTKPLEVPPSVTTQQKPAANPIKPGAAETAATALTVEQKPTVKPPAKVVPPKALEAVMGTYAVADHKGKIHIGNAMLVKLNPKQKNTLKIGVANQMGYKKNYQYLMDAPNSAINWFADPHYFNGEKYTVSTKIDGVVTQINTQIDPKDVMNPPGNLRIQSMGWNQIQVEWEAVPQAPIYFVQLYRKATEPVAVFSGYTRDPKFSFKRGLLRKTNVYFVSVAAFNVDVTNQKLPLPKQFNVSYADTAWFTLKNGGG